MDRNHHARCSYAVGRACRTVEIAQKLCNDESLRDLLAEALADLREAQATLEIPSSEAARKRESRQERAAAAALAGTTSSSKPAAATTESRTSRTRQDVPDATDSPSRAYRIEPADDIDILNRAMDRRGKP